MCIMIPASIEGGERYRLAAYDKDLRYKLDVLLMMVMLRLHRHSVARFKRARDETILKRMAMEGGRLQ
jgi:hypothetical protein